MKESQLNKIDIGQRITLILSKNNNLITNKLELQIDEICQKYKEAPDLLLDLIRKKVLINQQKPEIIDGFIFQKLMQSDIKGRLINIFPYGLLKLERSLSINYQPLQNLLMKQKFQEANQLTQEFMCQLVEIKTKYKRKWLYFTDIQSLPLEDLYVIDILWQIYSNGKFGFSIQKKIWIKNDKQWDKLWEKIYWVDKGIMRRYPKEFIWTTEAPEGHLPLFNQLRGTKTLLYLFNSIKW
uniref:GUN4-like domain-containing protein n=1 Tax=Digenea simplex TaxID=945030 RepID=A0A1Z1MU10_DIGSM|nr:hypothetical protein [Digenea simplex]ARW69446.1 hypothetical protein [Digenea simplex]